MKPYPALLQPPGKKPEPLRAPRVVKEKYVRREPSAPMLEAALALFDPPVARETLAEAWRVMYDRAGVTDG